MQDEEVLLQEVIHLIMSFLETEAQEMLVLQLTPT